MFNDPIQEEATVARLWEIAPAEVGGVAASPIAAVPAAHGEVLRGSAYLVANLAVGAVGSFAFWVVLARLEPPRVVGTAGALASVLMFLNYATSLGLPVVVPRYASGRAHEAKVLFCWALIATTVASVIGVAGYGLLAPSSSLRPLERELGRLSGLVLLAVLLIGFSLGALVDARLLTLRSWGWLTAKTLFVAIARFPLLVLRPTASPAVFLFAAVMMPTAAAGFAGAIALARGGWRLDTVRATVLEDAARFAGVNYVGLLALQAPTLALPLVVSENLSKTDYANFFVSFSITTVVFLVPTTIGQVLLAEGGTRGGDLTQQVRLSRRLALVAAAAMVLLSPVMAAALRAAYGPDYLDAARLLIPLVAAVLLWAVAAVYLAEARIDEHTGGTLAITGAFAVATLLPALVLIEAFGLAGVVATWTFGNVVVLIAAVVVHSRLRLGAARSIGDQGRGVMSETKLKAGSGSRGRWTIGIVLSLIVLFLIGAAVVITTGRDDSTKEMVDTFDRTADGAPLGRIPSGPHWQSVSGTWAATRGQAAVSDPGTPASVVVAKMPGPGQVATTVGHVVPGAGLVFRYQSPTSYWKVVAAPKVLTWQICKVQGNRVIVVGNTGQFSPVEDGTQVSVEVDGKSFEVRLDGKARKTIFDGYLSSATGAGMAVTGPDAEQARFSRFAFDPS